MAGIRGWRRMKIKCDICGQEFDTASIKLQQETDAAGIERIYYKAPCCGFEYSVALTDPHIRGLMEKRKSMLWLYHSKPSKYLSRLIDDTTKEIKEAMNKLNNKAG